MGISSIKHRVAVKFGKVTKANLGEVKKFRQQIRDYESARRLKYNNESRKVAYNAGDIWCYDDLVFVRDNWTKYKKSEIAKILKRSLVAVTKKHKMISQGILTFDDDNRTFKYDRSIKVTTNYSKPVTIEILKKEINKEYIEEAKAYDREYRKVNSEKSCARRRKERKLDPDKFRQYERNKYWEDKKYRKKKIAKVKTYYIDHKKEHYRNSVKSRRKKRKFIKLNLKTFYLGCILNNIDINELYTFKMYPKKIHLIYRDEIIAKTNLVSFKKKLGNYGKLKLVDYNLDMETRLLELYI